jgi:NRAMP (natural resistance-associated macrophage protein)-like metal ion transporter
VGDVLRQLGPGIVTGASRNDPSSITAYTMVGAKAGYALLWTLLISLPLLAGIQDISARVGRVTGDGIAGNLRRYYPRWLLYVIVSLLVIANTINLGADISMMGEAAKLLIGGPALLYSGILALLSVLLQVCISFLRYVSVLKWLALALLTYVATAAVVDVDWQQALRGLFVPTLSTSSWYLAALLAAFGATINPYLFFWQASQEVEEQDRNLTEVPLRVAPQQASEQMRRIKLDTYTGMAYSNAVAFCIMLTTAVTLHSRGITEMKTAAVAAETLRPAAGNFAFLLFSLGIIGTGLLAVPVLAGSLAYAVGESLNWPVSLQCKPIQGRGFYLVLAAAALVGYLLNLFGVNPVEALYWTAIINGIISAPTMAALMLMTTNPRVMGQETISLRLRSLGWIATAVIFAASLGLFASWLR